MVEIDWEFSSQIDEGAVNNINYMHVVAYGSKFESLADLVKGKLSSVSTLPSRKGKYDEQNHFRGEINGVDYDVLIVHGFCPVPFSGGEGHRVEVRVQKSLPDLLSPIIADEMRKYEAEMTEKRR